jgi:hypothetical protein
MTPEEELKRLNRVIRQFECVYKTTKDAMQKRRVTDELKKLKSYRDQLESFHELDPEAVEDPSEPDEIAGLVYLRLILASQEGKRPAKELSQEAYGSQELHHLALYLAFFEKEFLALLSETKLKLDFKHSLERDSFYHRFENLRRLFQDLRDDNSSVDAYLGHKHEEDMRRRSFKKRRNVVVEADKFLRSLMHFTGALLEEIQTQGSVCLNRDETLHFDRLEGDRYLEGVVVHEALAQLDNFAAEVIGYLNVPQIESQES